MKKIIVKDISGNLKPADALSKFLNESPPIDRDTTVVLMIVKEMSWDLVAATESAGYSYKRILSNLRKRCAKVVMIFNRWYQDFDDVLSVPGVENFYFDFFALVCYRRLYGYHENSIKISHSFDKDQSFLFFTGKANRPHRVGLVHLLSKEGLLTDKVNYSFQVNSPLLEEECRALLGIPEIEYKEFLTRYQKVLDVEYERVGDDLLSHYTGIPFDKELYESSNFQVISETNSLNSNPWITEKTWLAIINRMPFVLVGDRGICSRLESRGFKTFREYMLHPEYNELLTPQERLEHAVKNIKYWNKNIFLHQDDILKDIEHNFNLYLTLVNENLSLARTLVENYSIDVNPIDLFVGYSNNYPVKFKEKL